MRDLVIYVDCEPTAVNTVQLALPVMLLNAGMMP